MSGHQSVVDDKYVNGVFYDAEVSRICSIERGEEKVKIVNLETDEVYHTVDYDEWRTVKDDLKPISSKVQQDPVQYLKDWISRNRRQGDYDPELLYSLKMTEIIEKKQ